MSRAERASPRGPGPLLSAALALSAGVAALAGCKQDMKNGARAKPLEASEFFPDGGIAQRPPEGTVPRGDPRLDPVLYSGAAPDGGFVAEDPAMLDEVVLARGRERYAIFCSPCHGLVGDGQGMIVQRGYKQPPSFHSDRLRQQPAGYFVDVIANGFGVMPSYAGRVPPFDRWAIAIYVQALQLSQSASASELPPEDLQRVETSQ